MSNLSDSEKDAILNARLVSPGVTLYLALFDTDPADDGTGAVEISGAGYNRIPVTFGAVSSHGTSNNALLPFGLAQADWGTVGAWGIYDDLTAGTLRCHGPVGTPVTIVEDGVVKVLTGNLSVAWPA